MALALLLSAAAVVAAAEPGGDTAPVHVGKEMRLMNIGAAFPNAVAISPDGRTALLNAQGKLTLWNIGTGRSVRTLTIKGTSIPAGLRYVSPRQVLLARYDGTVSLIDVEADREIRLFDCPDKGRNAAGLSVSPDKKRLALAGVGYLPGGALNPAKKIDSSLPKVVRVWDMETGKLERELIGHTGRVAVTAFTPDGKRLVTIGADSILRIWDLATGLEVRAIPKVPHPGYRLHFLPDGRLVYSAIADDVHIVDLENEPQLDRLHVQEGLIVDMQVVGNRVVTIGAGGLNDGKPPDYTLRIWDLASRQEVARFPGHRKDITGTSLSRDGLALTVATDQTMRVWDLRRFLPQVEK